MSMRPSALKRFKDTYKTDDRVLPSLERHVMRAMASDGSDRRHDVLHPSEMSHKEWCGRHDYFRIVGTPSEKDAMANPSFRMGNIFAEGHTIHGKYQDWLWEMGVLHGEWLCLSCKTKWTGTSPRQCVTCGSPRLMYLEVPLNREIVGGHADGAIHGLGGWDGLIEIKSIGIGTIRMEAPRMYQRYLDGETLENLWWKIQRPFTTHIKQGMLYLWMAWPRYEEIVLIYESKFHQQVKEFTVSYNPTLIASVLETARHVNTAVAHDLPPSRPDWAEDSDSRICKSCPYRRTCWHLGAATHDQPQANDPEAVRVRTRRATPGKRRRTLRSA